MHLTTTTVVTLARLWWASCVDQKARMDDLEQKSKKKQEKLSAWRWDLAKWIFLDFFWSFVDSFKFVTRVSLNVGRWESVNR